MSKIHDIDTPYAIEMGRYLTATMEEHDGNASAGALAIYHLVEGMMERAAHKIGITPTELVVKLHSELVHAKDEITAIADRAERRAERASLDRVRSKLGVAG